MTCIVKAEILIYKWQVGMPALTILTNVTLCQQDGNWRKQWVHWPSFQRKANWDFWLLPE